jgi:rfaE bifunctional protein nucleotidyltransferase chain/domain
MDYRQIIQNKILDKTGLERQLNIWKIQSKKVVFTNGCFDILHKGHADYLAQAKNLGDILIVGLNADSSVKNLKGEGRPINPEDARAFLLASLHVVDAVILFSEPTPLELITLVQPDVLVKGSDYKPEEIVGYDVVIKKGGTVAAIDFVPGYSTTDIIKKLQS